jgi:protoporphyrin/coproporphyrin ferrochelatase
MTVGVVLMTYGAPDGTADLPRYLAAIRGGRAAEDTLVAEMARRYEAIGGSPLIEITERQAAALERTLGPGHRVAAGMRFSEPTIERAARGLLDAGVDRVVGVCLSPQWSDVLMGGYARALKSALAGRAEIAVAVAGSWFREPLFIAAIARRIGEALAALGVEGDRTPVVLTAHSLPRRVFENEAGYVRELRETAELVAARAGLSPERWTWAYQSAGHTAEEWLRPDLTDVFPALAAAGHRAVLIAPVQFLADHLEVLYDLDLAAAAQARAAGLAYRRIPMPNTDPTFIAALAAVVRRTARDANRAPAEAAAP